MLTFEEYLNEAKAPRWKKAGPNGEIEATIGGKKWKIEKALDHNERHRGEFKVYVWDKGNWECETTEYGKANAKDWIMDRMSESADPHPEVVKAYKKTLDAEDKAAEYNHRSNKARVTKAQNHLSKMIKKHHGDMASKDKIALRTKLQNMQEGSETWEAGYKRRVVKTTKPEHKEKGYNWRIKGKDRPEFSIKLYKSKPDFAEFKKQMRRVAGHEFGG